MPKHDTVGTAGQHGVIEYGTDGASSSHDHSEIQLVLISRNNDSLPMLTLATLAHV